MAPGAAAIPPSALRDNACNEAARLPDLDVPLVEERLGGCQGASIVRSVNIVRLDVVPTISDFIDSVMHCLSPIESPDNIMGDDAASAPGQCSTKRKEK